jgi:hypothetical protein
MITRLRRAWERATMASRKDGLHFERPLLLFQSDDWGRVGVRDRKGWTELEAAGVQLGEAPYDFYSLETADDVQALRDLLRRHHDSVGRNPSMVMNFMLANLDFERCLASRGNELPVIALTEGLPGGWQRPHLFDAYREGIQEGVFFAGLHGLTHFCQQAVLRELEAGTERAALITRMWKAQTPYIYWRMPWIGFEYWDRELEADQRFLSSERQRSAIRRVATLYEEFFGVTPLSACAPGYRANADTRTAWFDQGIRAAQNGPGERKRPYVDEQGMLHTFRTIEMEPAITNCDLSAVLKQVAKCFESGIPAVVSVHSINFHSTLRDFRTLTIALLGEFLSKVKKNWPDVHYVNDADLFRIAIDGFYFTQGKKIVVGASMKAKH